MRLLILLSALALGCASHPLGDDWESLDPADQDERAVSVLRKVIEGGVDGAGAVFSDREVLRCDTRGTSYRVIDEASGSAPSELIWSEVESVEAQPLTTFPSRPETLFVYLGKGRGKGVLDLVTPVLASAGLARSYLLLRSRERWSRSRMVLALEHLRGRATPDLDPEPDPEPEPEPRPQGVPVGPAPEAGPSPPKGIPVREAPSGSGSSTKAEPKASPAAPHTPESSDADSIETKLRRLKEWHEKKLIDDDEYRLKKQELLGRL
jgi:hypothetical protein